MTGWSTRKITLDPGIAALAHRHHQLNGDGWYYPAFERAQRRRVILRAVWEGVGFAFVIGLVTLAFYVVGWR